MPIVAGKIVSDNKLFKHVLDTDSNFRQRMQDLFDSNSKYFLTNWKKFLDFVECGCPAENIPEKWSAEEHDEMNSNYVDEVTTIHEHKWILPSGNELEIFELFVDTDEFVHIVGKIVQPISSGKIDLQKVINECEKMKNDQELDEVDVYLIE
jgi:hypothetical protein